VTEKDFPQEILTIRLDLEILFIIIVLVFVHDFLMKSITACDGVLCNRSFNLFLIVMCWKSLKEHG